MLDQEADTGCQTFSHVQSVCIYFLFVAYFQQVAWVSAYCPAVVVCTVFNWVLIAVHTGAQLIATQARTYVLHCELGQHQPPSAADVY